MSPDDGITDDGKVGEGKTTLQERVYQTLRAEIMTGRFRPGRSVTIRGLADSLGVSSMPVREALRRLVSEHALTLKPNRRVEVPAMTVEAFEELAEARVALEVLAARRAYEAAAARGNLDALAARLERIDAEQDVAIETGDWEAYLQKNLDFHFTLYDAARSRVTVPLIESLWLQIGPFLYLTRETLGVTYNEDRHKEAVAALRGREIDALAHAIEQDIRDGMGSLPRGKLPFAKGAADHRAT
ncbi:GntR family transcriptional regulator [Marivibrio halodurans]|uniref:GntR family transcriptional regulator n=1 Tax=Marivibrio halodurans TaxID=2039722 RepID=A0A8J7S466_9PROT|nr:GntR family transcriptional regulator [Marivibrio halodurans]MBP5856434.1 GntR family transcriptional regulator [Marivibrio halodurans]